MCHLCHLLPPKFEKSQVQSYKKEKRTSLKRQQPQQNIRENS